MIMAFGPYRKALTPTPDHKTSSRRMTAVFILSLMAAGALVYANALSGPFVFDDINFITKNDPSVHMTQFSWENIKKAAIEGKPRHRYLPNVSFAVNYYFGGENPFGYHLVNLGIHLLSGMALFLLFRQTLWLGSGRQTGENGENSDPAARSCDLLAFFAAVVWLVH
ncbi:MAG: hypothetical protein RBT16_12250, partial [Desulfococcus multivorans]|nr:hypothetical protein [Desulfococcus multivorans]